MKTNKSAGAIGATAAGTPSLPTPRELKIMLLALCMGFTLSQAFRTLAAMMAPPLAADMRLSPSELGIFAATFHFAFGAMQMFMGIGIDLHGVRRTVLVAFPLAIAGALLCALAPSFPVVVMGQALIGVGCAPAFLACTVFIARSFPAAQFAAISGAVMGLGGVGMLITGTPLAWLVDQTSWRAGFYALAAGSVAAWLVMYALVRDARPTLPEGESAPRRETLPEAMRKFGALVVMPHTLGIVALASVTYASFITLRGLWLGPMLTEQYGFTLVQSGNVALAVSLASLFGPPLFGRIRTQGLDRRRWILRFTLFSAVLYVALALLHSAVATVVIAIVIGFFCGYVVMQYSDVRASYPESITGRALAVFTMALFLGIAVMQWVTGLVASAFTGTGISVYTAVNMTVAALLVAGAAAFKWLPAKVENR